MEGVTSECEKGEKHGVDKVGAGQRLCVRAEAHRHIDGWRRRKNKRNEHQHDCACEPRLTVISTAGGDERKNKKSTNAALRASRGSPSYRRLV